MSQDPNNHAKREAKAEPESPFIVPIEADPPIDQEKVARARRLLEQDGYPSDKVIQSVARRLASEWQDLENPTLPSARG